MRAERPDRPLHLHHSTDGQSTACGRSTLDSMPLVARPDRLTDDPSAVTCQMCTKAIRRNGMHVVRFDNETVSRATMQLLNRIEQRLQLAVAVAPTTCGLCGCLLRHSEELCPQCAAVAANV